MRKHSRIPFAMIFALISLATITFGCVASDDDDADSNDPRLKSACEKIAYCGFGDEANITSMSECIDIVAALPDATLSCVEASADCDQVASCLGIGDSDDDNDSDNDDDADDDIDDDVNDDVDDDDLNCDNNNPPDIYMPFIALERNGEDKFQYLPALLDLNDSHEIRFYYRYEDPECNLVGGHVWYAWDDDEFEMIGEIAGDYLCSFNESGEYLSLILHGSIGEQFGPGEYILKIYLSDACDDQSEEIEYALTILDGLGGDGQELIEAGGFEKEGVECDDVHWEAHSLLGFQLIKPDLPGNLPYLPNQGRCVSWMGSYPQGHDIVRQRLTIPAETEKLRFEAWIRAITTCPNCDRDDFLYIYFADEEGQKLIDIKTISNTEAFYYHYGLVRAFIEGEDIENLAGREVSLVFEYYSGEDFFNTYYLVDDVSLTSLPQNVTKATSRLKGPFPEISPHNFVPSFETGSNEHLFEGGSNDPNKDDACTGNQRPEIWIRYMEIDEVDVRSPVFGIFGVDETIFSLMDWSDPECSIEGGSISGSFLPHTWTHYELPIWEDFGCGSEDSGKVFVDTFTPLVGRQHRNYSTIVDSCGAFAEPVSYAYFFLPHPEDDQRTNSVLNGDFEEGGQNWSQNPDGSIDIGNTPDLSKLGEHYAALSGSEGATITLSQELEIPQECRMASLSFWLLVISSVEDSPVLDTLEVAFEGEQEPFQTFSNQLAAVEEDQHRFYYYEVTPFIGEEVTLQFTADFSTEYLTTFYIDTVSLRCE